jgi:hypothetical protein
MTAFFSGGRNRYQRRSCRSSRGVRDDLAHATGSIDPATVPRSLGCVEDVGLAVGQGQVQLQVADVGIAAHQVRVRPRAVGRRALGSQRHDAAGSLTEPRSELWMAQSVEDWHRASVYSYRPSAVNR